MLSVGESALDPRAAIPVGGQIGEARWLGGKTAETLFSHFDMDTV